MGILKNASPPCLDPEQKKPVLGKGTNLTPEFDFIYEHRKSPSM